MSAFNNDLSNNKIIHRLFSYENEVTILPSENNKFRFIGQSKGIFVNIVDVIEVPTESASDKVWNNNKPVDLTESSFDIWLKTHSISD